MTLNGVMAIILRYFTEFVYGRRKTITSVLKPTFDDHNTICAIIQRLFGQNKL